MCAISLRQAAATVRLQGDPAESNIGSLASWHDQEALRQQSSKRSKRIPGRGRTVVHHFATSRHSKTTTLSERQDGFAYGGLRAIHGLVQQREDFCSKPRISFEGAGNGRE